MVLIGHAGHPEVEGTMGQWNRQHGSGEIHLVESLEDVAAMQVAQPGNLAFTTQTTLSVDDTMSIIKALRARFPAIEGPRHDDICYATQNRQDAVRKLSEQCDLVLVVGSPNSSNSNRLAELAERQGIEAHLVDGAGEIDPQWLRGRTRIGVTAGASAPEVLVRGVIDRLRELGAGEVRDLEGEPENMVFALPKELRLQLVD
jgi:4-hydroxy-3-methylbut-2-enyl diphosphate reductase